MFNDYDKFIKLALTALDVLIVAFLFYRVYILLNRTRAVQLIFGMGLILIVELVSRKFDLLTTSWLITNVTSYLVIGLIILMQPELRRLAAEIGRMPVFQWFSPPPEVPLDEILTAVKDMALKKVGSIIVIMRKIRSQSIIENAVQINSTITSELLETIFFKDSPLHDGAVMIEGSRIIAASCYLPLSATRHIKKTYGARHRAALGYSEESDAVIIVTSEETGKITLVKNGEMQIVRQNELDLKVSQLLKHQKPSDVVENIKNKYEIASQ